MTATAVAGERESLYSAVRSVGLNTIYQIGSQVVPAIAAIAAIPFLLRHMGAELFGIITIFSTGLLYFTMLDLGLGRAATRFIAQSMEAGRPDEVRRYLWGSILLLLSMGVLVGFGAALTVPVLVSKYLHIAPDYARAAIESFYIICFAVPVVTLTATFRGFLEASGRFAFVSFVSGCSGICTYVLPVLAISLGGGLVSIAAIYALVRTGMCVAFAVGCVWDKNRPSLRPIFDFAAVRRMLTFGGWLSVSNVIGAAMIYCDRLLVGVWVGMAAVASYGMPLDVISRLQILITSFCAVLFPLMSRLDESGSIRFQALYRGAAAIGLSTMTPIVLLAVVTAPFLMKVWLGQRNTPDAVFAAQVFLAGAVVQAMASVAWTALHARGRSDLTAWIHMAEFPLYCAAFYLAATRFGVRGAALAWFGRIIVDFICMVVLLQLQNGDRAFGVAPELVAGGISGAILLLPGLPLRTATAVALAICIATWVWCWRRLFDPALRARVFSMLATLRTPATL